MSVPEAIKELRSSMKLTQTQLANILGVTFATVNRWENGRCVPVGKVRARLVSLCKKHKIKVEFGSEGNQNV